MYTVNDLERSLWAEWENRSVRWHREDLGRAIGIYPVTRKAIWNWLYSIGIQPDCYIVQKSGYGYLEIRFRSDSDLAFYRMALDN